MSAHSQCLVNGSQTSLGSSGKPFIVGVEEKSARDVPPQQGVSSGPYKDTFPNIQESKLIRKIDMRVVPFIFILNFFTFLDR